MRVVRGAVALLALAGVGVAPAAADEAKTPVSATILMNVLSVPAQTRDAAYDRAITDPAPAPRGDGPVVLPDGSVRYGTDSRNVTLTVRNPCPPGTAHYEPPPLPGRRSRN
jgi:hypothetical protein